MSSLPVVCVVRVHVRVRVRVVEQCIRIKSLVSNLATRIKSNKLGKPTHERNQHQEHAKHVFTTNTQK